MAWDTATCKIRGGHDSPCSQEGKQCQALPGTPTSRQPIRLTCTCFRSISDLLRSGLGSSAAPAPERTCVAVANSLATGIRLGLFVLSKETEDCSVSESCSSFCTAPSPTTLKTTEQTEKSKMIICCWKPACFRLAAYPCQTVM